MYSFILVDCTIANIARRPGRTFVSPQTCPQAELRIFDFTEA